MDCRTITPAELHRLLRAGDSIALLDVRRREDLERSQDALPGARWCDPARVDAWVSEVPRDRSVVLYCVRGGSVSNAVTDALRAAGVDAQYIEGGLEACRAAGLSLTRR